MSSPLFVYANLTIDRSDPVQIEIWLKSAMIRNFRNVNQNMILLDFPYNPFVWSMVHSSQNFLSYMKICCQHIRPPVFTKN